MLETSVVEASDSELLEAEASVLVPSGCTAAYQFQALSQNETVAELVHTAVEEPLDKWTA